MLDDPPQSPEPTVLVWDEADVRLLDELAALGMDMARSHVERMRAHDEAAARGDVAPLSLAYASRAANDFARIARAVRLTLLLKARARGEHPESRRAPSKGCSPDAAEERDIPESREVEPMDARRERDRETPDVPLGADFDEVVRRIARDLGVEVIRATPAGPAGGAHDWIIIRPEDSPLATATLGIGAAKPVLPGAADGPSRSNRFSTAGGGALPRGQAP